MKCFYTVLTIILTGEWMAGVLARNSMVLIMIILVLGIWYAAARRVQVNEPSADNHLENLNQESL